MCSVLTSLVTLNVWPKTLRSTSLVLNLPLCLACYNSGCLQGPSICSSVIASSSAKAQPRMAPTVTGSVFLWGYLGARHLESAEHLSTSFYYFQPVVKSYTLFRTVCDFQCLLPLLPSESTSHQPRASRFHVRPSVQPPLPSCCTLLPEQSVRSKTCFFFFSSPQS